MSGADEHAGRAERPAPEGSRPREQQVYDLAPAEERPASPAPTAPAPPSTEPRLTPQEAQARLDAADAAAEAARRREIEAEIDPDVGSGEREAAAGKEVAPLVRASFTQGQLVAGFAGGLLVGATITAGVRAERGQLLAALSTGYLTLILSVLGVVAAWLWSRLESRPLGSLLEAWARIGCAVTAGAFTLHLMPAVGPPWLAGALRTLMAVGVYLVSLIVLLRWSPRRAARVGMIHALLAAGLWLAVELHACAQSAGTPASP